MDGGGKKRKQCRATKQWRKDPFLTFTTRPVNVGKLKMVRSRLKYITANEGQVTKGTPGHNACTDQVTKGVEMTSPIKSC